MGGNAEGSLKLSALEFISYRLLELNFRCGSRVSFSSPHTPRTSRNKVGLGFGDIVHVPDQDMYFVPLSADLTVSRKGSHEDDETALMFQTSGTIIGHFRFKSGTDYSEDLKQKLLLHQTSAILMPFLRAALSSQFAIAGFGAFPFPLINMAEKAGRIDRKIISMTTAQMEAEFARQSAMRAAHAD